jgi:RNA polymerase sigma-70 factor (ECF subfamily)
MYTSNRREMAFEPCADPADDHLLPRIAAGDAQAFATFYQRRQAEVHRFALHMTGSASIAEDVTQDVFLAVMRDAARYTAARGTVSAWLCGIARNHVRRRLARDWRLAPLDAGEERLDCEGQDHRDPLGDLMRAERIDALRRAVATLPIGYREAVVLCDLQELTYADAAAALGCAIGTVRSRLHRGRALLSAKLQASQKGPEQVDRASCPASAPLAGGVAAQETVVDPRTTQAPGDVEARGSAEGTLEPRGCFA